MGGEIHWKDVINAAKATASAIKDAYVGIKEFPEAISKLSEASKEFQSEEEWDKERQRIWEEAFRNHQNNCSRTNDSKDRYRNRS